MSTSGNTSALVQAFKDLSMQWQQARAYWNDVKSHEFQQKYLEELPGLVSRATTSIEEIDALIKKVRGDCE